MTSFFKGTIKASHILKVQQEDNMICESVQTGLESSAYDVGRLLLCFLILRLYNFYIRRKLDIHDATHIFFIWMRNGSNPPDINRFRINHKLIISSALVRFAAKMNQ